MVNRRRSVKKSPEAYERARKEAERVRELHRLSAFRARALSRGRAHYTPMLTHGPCGLELRWDKTDEGTTFRARAIGFPYVGCGPTPRIAFFELRCAMMCGRANLQNKLREIERQL